MVPASERSRQTLECEEIAMLCSDVGCANNSKTIAQRQKPGRQGQRERDKARRITEFPTNGSEKVAVIHITVYRYELSNSLTTVF
jgi:hypothetical protein